MQGEFFRAITLSFAPAIRLCNLSSRHPSSKSMQMEWWKSPPRQASSNSHRRSDSCGGEYGGGFGRREFVSMERLGKASKGDGIAASSGMPQWEDPNEGWERKPSGGGSTCHEISYRKNKRGMSVCEPKDLCYYQTKV